MSLFIVWSKRVDVEKIEGIFGGKGSKVKGRIDLIERRVRCRIFIVRIRVKVCNCWSRSKSIWGNRNGK